jgi:hypothetical protein
VLIVVLTVIVGESLLLSFTHCSQNLTIARTCDVRRRSHCHLWMDISEYAGRAAPTR